jgi:pyruvate/2-oxoglutarate dehydrogenase complex dihydrolipoamide acyltransferase (E2) component
MTEGTIVRWEKRVGEPVRAGEVLLRIETDLSEEAVAAPAEGILLRIDADVDEIVACGTVIAWLGQAGETP